MRYAAINLREKLDSFEGLWQPRVVAELNDYQFKLVKLQGDFKELTQLMLVEPRGVPNTGDEAPSDRTAPSDVWI